MPEFAPIPREGESVRHDHWGNWFWRCRCGFEASCCEDVGGHRSACPEERFAPVTKSAPLDAYQDERRLACDLGLCEQHGSRTPREHLVVPNGNTDTEKRAEDTECDRSVTPDHRRGRRFKT